MIAYWGVRPTVQELAASGGGRRRARPGRPRPAPPAPCGSDRDAGTDAARLPVRFRRGYLGNPSAAGRRSAGRPDGGRTWVRGRAVLALAAGWTRPPPPWTSVPGGRRLRSLPTARRPPTRPGPRRRRRRARRRRRHLHPVAAWPPGPPSTAADRARRGRRRAGRLPHEGTHGDALLALELSAGPLPPAQPAACAALPADREGAFLAKMTCTMHVDGETMRSGPGS